MGVGIITTSTLAGLVGQFELASQNGVLDPAGEVALAKLPARGHTGVLALPRVGDLSRNAAVRFTSDGSPERDFGPRRPSLKLADRVELTDAALPLASLTDDDKKRITVELTKELYALLRQFRPAGRNTTIEHYWGLAFDKEGYPIHVQMDSQSGIIRVFNGKEAGMSENHYTAILPEFSNRQLADMGPGTEKFRYLESVVRALRERLASASKKETTRRLLKHPSIAEARSARVVDVLENVWDPEACAARMAKYEALRARNASIAPLQEIPLEKFISVVAKLIKHRHPSSKATGEETRWEEIGDNPLWRIYTREMATYYRANPDFPSEMPTIDLMFLVDADLQAYRKEVHFDTFKLHLQWSDTPEVGVRFVLKTHRDHPDVSVTSYLDLYEILIDQGLPVAFEDSFIKDVKGERKVEVSRRDKRLRQLGIPLPTIIGMPLPKKEKPSLPSTYGEWVAACVAP